MPYTPQQALAIQTRDVSIALAAGAGCGKTFVLTQRFVSELLRAPQAETLSGMMAITFTDRAAREMRDRIREAVREELAKCPDEQLAQWQEILQELESARIQTIHSFCASTLRSHATELGLDPDFAVLDEPTATALRNEVIQTELIRLLKTQDEAVCELVLRFGLEGVVARLQSLMSQRFQLAEVQKLADSETELVTLWRNYHREQFLPERLREIAASPAASQLFELLRENEPANPRMQDRRAILLIHLETLQRTGHLSQAELQELRDNATVQYVTAKHWSSPEIHEQVRDWCKILRDQLDALLPMYQLDEQELQLSARFGIQALQLMTATAETYSQRKQEQAVLDFDDLLLMLRELVENHESARNQLQNSIRFLMLDEFQDTDPVQTQIVQALCGDRLTTGGLFLVGDVKQSIYRFRRADPEVFRELRRQIPEQGQLSLTKNFRSQQEILDFVNFLFGPAMSGEYDPLQAFDQGPYPPAEKIEFLLVDLGEESEEKLKADETRRLEAEWIAARISALLAEETPRVRRRNRSTGAVELRRVEPGDIVILFRAFSNLGLYEEALRQAEIDYYVVGGRAFFAQQEIYDLVNLCRFLDDDTDEIALAGILRSPLFGWSDDTLMLLKQACDGLGAAIRSDVLPVNLPAEQQTCVRQSRLLLNQLLLLRMSVGIGELLRYAIQETAYDAALMTEFLGERKVANLQKLLDMADDFDRIGLLGLAEFADRLLESVTEEAKEELAATHPETGNVVRLMTVHQSKGLEFPVVVVADIGRKLNSSSDSVVLSPQLGPLVSLPKVAGVEYDNPAMKMFRDREKREDEAESIRLFYVAATRAADHLILSGCKSAEGGSSGPWLKLLEERFQLDSGLPQGDPWLGQTQQPGMDWQQIPRIAVVSKKPTPVETASKPRRLRLAEWEAVLATAEPEPPAPLALPLLPDRSARDRFSVSELEAVESELRYQQQKFSPIQKPAPVLPTQAGKSDSTLASGNEPRIPVREAERLGNLLHAAMERLDLQQLPDPEEYIRQIKASSEDYYSDQLLETAVTRFRLILQSDWLQELQTARVLLRETEFLLRWTSDAISQPAVILGTVDCLLQDQTGDWHLIDYKTGALPENTDEVVQKFGLQMTLYALAIQQWTGHLPASIRIVQLSEHPRMVTVPFDNTLIEHFHHSVDTAINWLRSNPLP